MPLKPFVADALHSSLARSDESGSSDATVVEDGNVVLVGGVSSLSEHDLHTTKVSVLSGQGVQAHEGGAGRNSRRCKRDQQRQSAW